MKIVHKWRGHTITRDPRRWELGPTPLLSLTFGADVCSCGKVWVV